jgi:hypothetical protein
VKDIENIEAEESDELLQYTQSGSIAKLHNFIVRTQRSAQRYQRFLVLSLGKQLPRDNSTRWNSFEKMISSALKPQVRAAIERSIEENEEDEFTQSDWEELQKVS